MPERLEIVIGGENSAARRVLAETERELRELGGAAGAAERGINAAANKVNALGEAQRRAAGHAAELAAGQKAAERAAYELAGRVGLVNQKLMGFSQARQHVAGVTSEIGRMSGALTKVGVAASAGLGYSLVQFAGLDDSLARTRARLGATSKEMAELGRVAKRLGNDERFPAYSGADIGRAMAKYAEGGLSARQIAGGAAEAAALGGAAGRIDIEESAQLGLDAMTTFKLRAEELPRVMDQLAASALAGGQSFGQLHEALKMGGGAAEMFNRGSVETLATLAALSRHMLRGSDAGTAYKNFMLRLAPTTKEAKEALDSLGLSFTDAQGKIRPMVQVAELMHQKFGKLSDAELTAKLTPVFGLDSIRVASALTREGAEGLLRYEQAVGQVGFASGLAKQQNDSLAGSWESLKSSVETTATTLGEEMAPAARLVLNVLQGLVGAIGGDSIFGRFARDAAKATAALATLGGAYLMAAKWVVEYRAAKTLLTLAQQEETAATVASTAADQAKAAAEAQAAAATQAETAAVMRNSTATVTNTGAQQAQAAAQAQSAATAVADAEATTGNSAATVANSAATAANAAAQGAQAAAEATSAAAAEGDTAATAANSAATAANSTATAANAVAQASQTAATSASAVAATGLRGAFIRLLPATAGATGGVKGFTAAMAASLGMVARLVGGIVALVGTAVWAADRLAGLSAASRELAENIDARAEWSRDMASRGYASPEEAAHDEWLRKNKPGYLTRLGAALPGYSWYDRQVDRYERAAGAAPKGTAPGPRPSTSIAGEQRMQQELDRLQSELPGMVKAAGSASSGGSGGHRGGSTGAKAVAAPVGEKSPAERMAAQTLKEVGTIYSKSIPACSLAVTTIAKHAGLLTKMYTWVPSLQKALEQHPERFLKLKAGQAIPSGAIRIIPSDDAPSGRHAQVVVGGVAYGVPGKGQKLQAQGAARTVRPGDAVFVPRGPAGAAASNVSADDLAAEQQRMARTAAREDLAVAQAGLKVVEERLALLKQQKAAAEAVSRTEAEVVARQGQVNALRLEAARLEGSAAATAAERLSIEAETLATQRDQLRVRQEEAEEAARQTQDEARRRNDLGTFRSSEAAAWADRRAGLVATTGTPDQQVQAQLAAAVAHQQAWAARRSAAKELLELTGDQLAYEQEIAAIKREQSDWQERTLAAQQEAWQESNRAAEEAARERREKSLAAAEGRAGAADRALRRAVATGASKEAIETARLAKEQALLGVAAEKARQGDRAGADEIATQLLEEKSQRRQDGADRLLTAVIGGDLGQVSDIVQTGRRISGGADGVLNALAAPRGKDFVHQLARAFDRLEDNLVRQIIQAVEGRR